jgi:hypothetical protein
MNITKVRKILRKCVVQTTIIGICTYIDVIITIFGDFRQFSAKKLAFSQKPML